MERMHWRFGLTCGSCLKCQNYSNKGNQKLVDINDNVVCGRLTSTTLVVRNNHASDIWDLECVVMRVGRANQRPEQTNQRINNHKCDHSGECPLPAILNIHRMFEENHHFESLSDESAHQHGVEDAMQPRPQHTHLLGQMTQVGQPR